MKLEITSALPEDARKSFLLDNHSLLNIFNVLHLELQKVIETLKDENLNKYIDFTVDILLELGETDVSSKFEIIESDFANLSMLIKQFIFQYPHHATMLKLLLDIIENAFSRLNEFRHDRYIWLKVPCEILESKLYTFLAATERTSRGRFKFYYSHKQEDSEHYSIEFHIYPSNGSIFAPLVINDIIRDLTANARKYSPLGSKIMVCLKTIENNGLELVVSDNGRGIPEDEIASVVEMGYRASNVEDVRTFGGGFGLTKAYKVCKHFQGRFFIESALDKGTCITMTFFPDLLSKSIL